jgi:hypothetical protein
LWTGRLEPKERPEGSLDRNPYHFLSWVWAK